MGLYIGFDVFDKVPVQRLLSDDGKIIVCDEDEDDEFAYQLTYAWRNTVMRDLLKEIVMDEETNHVIITRDKLVELIDIVSKRKFADYEEDHARAALALFNKMLRNVNFETEYLTYFISQ